MSDAFLKWIVTQSDRGLFIIALSIGGWLFWRVLKRSETQTDSLLEAMKDQRDKSHAQTEAVQAKLLENCENLAKVVAMNTTATERNSRLLEQVERKLISG